MMMFSSSRKLLLRLPTFEELQMPPGILTMGSSASGILSLLMGGSIVAQTTCCSTSSLSRSIPHNSLRRQLLARYLRRIANIVNSQDRIAAKSFQVPKQTFIATTTGGNRCRCCWANKQGNILESSASLSQSLANFNIINTHSSIHEQQTCDTKLKSTSIDCLHYEKPTQADLLRPPIMFAKLLARFMSTLQMMKNNALGDSVKPISSSASPSGDPIERLTSNPKGHKRIKINACGELYRELATTKPSLFGGAPKDHGIDFEICYYDSWDLLDPVDRDRAPTVCLLHGAPGSYADFDQLIHHLTTKGVRVLAPSFPAYSATYEHSFRHSPRERLDYLLEFFKALRVTNIDMLIGFSSSVYTVFELLNKSLLTTPSTTSGYRINIKSLGLFNTPSYNLPPNLAVTPFRLFTLKLFDYPLLRPIIVAMIQIFVKLQGIHNKVEPNKIENLLIAASTVGYSDNEKMSKQLELVHKFQVPTFLLIGCRDKLIPMSCFDQLKRDLGIEDESQVKLYGQDGQLIRDASKLQNDNKQPVVQVSQFESGGHYTFMKYSHQVNEDVYDFLTTKVLALPEPPQQVVESTKL